MDKNDILEKSKDEFKNSDPYVSEIRKTCMQRGMAVTLVLSVLFFFLEIFIKKEMNLGFLAINCVSAATSSWAEYKLFPKKSRFIVAVLASTAVVIAAFGYILSIFIGE